MLGIDLSKLRFSSTRSTLYVGNLLGMVLIKIPMILKHQENVCLNGSSSTLLLLYVLRKRVATACRQHALKKGYRKGQLFGLLAIPEYVKILLVNSESW